MPIDLTPYEHICYNCKEIIPAGALRFEKEEGDWCVYCFPERKEEEIKEVYDPIESRYEILDLRRE